MVLLPQPCQKERGLQIKTASADLKVCKMMVCHTALFGALWLGGPVAVPRQPQWRLF